MNNKVKTVVYIIVFVLFITVAVFAYNYLSTKYKADNQLQLNPEDYESENNTATPAETSENREEKNDRLKAIDFTAYDADGNKVSLFDYIGTPIVLNFWASWCPPCKMEMPHFNKVSEEYSKDELIFLMVDLVDGQRETVETGKAYIEENGYTFTVLYDSDQEAAYTYSIRSIPCTLFIDSEGYVEAGVEGSIDEDTLRRGIDLILK